MKKFIYFFLFFIFFLFAFTQTSWAEDTNEFKCSINVADNATLYTGLGQVGFTITSDKKLPQKSVFVTFTGDAACVNGICGTKAIEQTPDENGDMSVYVHFNSGLFRGKLKVSVQDSDNSYQQNHYCSTEFDILPPASIEKCDMSVGSLNNNNLSTNDDVIVKADKFLDDSLTPVNDQSFTRRIEVRSGGKDGPKVQGIDVKDNDGNSYRDCPTQKVLKEGANIGKLGEGSYYVEIKTGCEWAGDNYACSRNKIPITASGGQTDGNPITGIQCLICQEGYRFQLNSESKPSCLDINSTTGSSIKPIIRYCNNNQTCFNHIGCYDSNPTEKQTDLPQRDILCPDNADKTSNIVVDENGKAIRCNAIPSGLGIAIPTDFGKFVTAILGIVLSISGGIAVLLIIVSGYRLMVSQGNPEKIQAAKDELTAAIVGFLFIIFSLVILQVIGFDILHLPGFS